jgi:hypothetical protein
MGNAIAHLARANYANCLYVCHLKERPTLNNLLLMFAGAAS